MARTKQTAETKQKVNATEQSGSAAATGKAGTEHKRPKTAFFWFSDETRPKILEEKGKIAVTEVAKILGERWKSLDDNARAVYEKKANADKARWEKLCAQLGYVPETKKAAAKKAKEAKAAARDASPKRESPKKAKKEKDPNAPKRPRSAYILFSTEQRASVLKDHPEYAPKEVTVELGARWGKLSEAEKKQYQEQNEADKERYKREMESYKPTLALE